MRPHTGPQNVCQDTAVLAQCCLTTASMVQGQRATSQAAGGRQQAAGSSFDAQEQGSARCSLRTPTKSVCPSFICVHSVAQHGGLAEPQGQSLFRRRRSHVRDSAGT